MSIESNGHEYCDELERISSNFIFFMKTMLELHNISIHTQITQFRLFNISSDMYQQLSNFPHNRHYAMQTLYSSFLSIDESLVYEINNYISRTENIQDISVRIRELLSHNEEHISTFIRLVNMFVLKNKIMTLFKYNTIEYMEWLKSVLIKYSVIDLLKNINGALPSYLNFYTISHGFITGIDDLHKQKNIIHVETYISNYELRYNRELYYLYNILSNNNYMTVFDLISTIYTEIIK
jgi:hypothetical protein